MIPRLLLATLALAGTTLAGPSWRNDIPPRLQWEANGGYCGEVSLISAGLYYGQYLSQYQARICAIGNTPQNKGEMLLGQNDRRAADRMHLAAENWDGRQQRSTGQFLRWVKRHVLQGHPVIIGVYNNETTLYGRTDPQSGDPQYDHIVTVSRIRSNRSFDETRYLPGDRLTLSDNGLFGSAGDHPYFYHYRFGAFPADRAEANTPGGPLYSLPDYGRNYGLVVTGVKDRDGVTLPVRIATSRNDEPPVMQRGGTRRPAPMPLTLSVTVSDLTPGIDYRLYRYDTLTKVPDAQFNAQAGNAAEVRNLRIASGSTFTLTQDILSNDIVVYRCVPATAP